MQAQTNIMQVTKFIRTAKIGGSYVIQVNTNGINNWVTVSSSKLFGIDDSTSTVDRYVNFKNHRFVLDSIFTAGSGYISGIYTGKASTSTSFRQTTYDSEAYLAFPRDEYKWVQLGSEAAGTDGDGAYFRDSYFKSYNSNATINAYASNYQGLFNSSIEINHNGINLFPDRGVLFIDSLLTSSSNSDEVVMWRAGDYGSIRRMPISTFLSFYTPPASWLQSGSVAGSLGTTFIGATDFNPLLFKIGGASAGILGGNGNTAFGLGANNADSLSNAGTYNTAMGLYSLSRNRGSVFNTAIGSNSMFYNTTGSQNVALGSNSLYNNTTGQKNSAFGAGALENNTSGDDNTAVGQDALLANTTGIRNIGIGWNGFANNFTGYHNVGIGYGTGKTITHGINNTIIGAFAAWNAAQNDTITGAVIIGHEAIATEDSTVQLGANYIKKTHLKGVVYAPSTPASGTPADSALALNRSTGYFEMRPVTGGSGGSGDGIASLGNSPYGLTKPNDSTYAADTSQLATILQTQHRIDSLAALKLAITDTTGQWIGSGWLASLVKYVDTTTVIATRTWVQSQGYITTRDRFAYTTEDVSASANRTFNLNNYKLDLDSGSFHIKRKVTSPRSDDIFSVGVGSNKAFYVDSLGRAYSSEFGAGSGSLYVYGGGIIINNTDIRLNGTTKFSSFQKKFEFIKEYPGLNDSIGMEISNDTLAISTFPDTWSNTYKILSLKYRSGVDNSLNNRYDFYGNGQPRFYMFGDSSFLDTPVTIAGFDADGNMIEVLPSSLGGGGADGNNYPTSVGYTQSTRTLTIARNGLADITTTLPEATTSLAGLLAGADKSFLDSLRAGQIIDTSYYGIISGPTTHDSAFVYWIPYSESNVDSSYMFLIPKYNSGGSGITQLGNTGNLWLTRVNDSTYAVDSATLFDYGLRRNDSASAANLTGFTTDTYVRNFVKIDTTTLASFGAGGGQAGDTTAFSTSTIYGSFYNDGIDTLVITSMRGILQGTSPSVTYDVYYNDSLNVTAGASKLVTAGTALTNTATGAAVTSFNNTKIPPGVWVWVKTTTVTTKPTYFSLSLVGYKSRRL